MNVFYFYERYLNKLSDPRFVFQYEKSILHNMRRFFLIIFFTYIGLVLLSGYLTSLTNNGLTVIFVMFIVTFLLGFVLLKQTLSFLGRQNARYLQAKMQLNDTIDYSNVI